MVRSTDLDKIAPDDPVIEAVKNKDKKTNSKPVIETELNSLSSEEKENIIPKFKEKIYGILGHTKSPLSSFIVRPDVFDFPERDQDEEIILAVRPHWFTNVAWICMASIMVLIPFILNFFDALKFLPFRYEMISTLFWYLITFIYAFEKFLHWYFNVFIITNERLVDIDFNNMLNKHFGEADIDMIQDVSSSVKGVFGTFFNFGTVLIQTASEINQINFENVPNPEKIIKVLQELRETSEDERRGGCSQ